MYAGAIYDAILLYALALNDSLAQGVSKRDGRAIVRNMLNREFQGGSWQQIQHVTGGRTAGPSLRGGGETRSSPAQCGRRSVGQVAQAKCLPERGARWRERGARPPRPESAATFISQNLGTTQLLVSGRKIVGTWSRRNGPRRTGARYETMHD